jgi:CheY-like chemotaxis protein
MGPILIVDDEFGILETLQDLLQDEGYPTAAALNGRQALERMAVERPSLVLLDYMMPVMNGPALLDAMEKDERLRDIPVVIMSASPAQSWQHLRAAAFLPKPFELEALLTTVRRLTGAPDGK